MKKMLLIAAMVFGMVVMSSCSGYNRMTYNTMNQTHVLLDKANFEVVGQVEGSFTAEYVLYIGGYSKSALKDNAVEQMYKNANLKGSQTIVNINFSTSVRTVLGFYSEYTVTAYGTVIEFK